MVFDAAINDFIFFFLTDATLKQEEVSSTVVICLSWKTDQLWSNNIDTLLEDNSLSLVVLETSSADQGMLAEKRGCDVDAMKRLLD